MPKRAKNCSSVQNPVFQEIPNTIMQQNNHVQQQQQEDEDEKDLISSLPDDILLTVISNLKNTHESILMETLSKRWTHFSSLRFNRLYLDQRAFNKHQLGSKHSFVQFVDWILNNRKGSALDFISFSCLYTKKGRVSLWLRKFLENPIPSIELHLCSSTLPSWIVSPPQLDKYRVHTVNFLHLTHLRLDYATIPSVTDLLYGFTFPAMETLELNCCIFPDSSKIVIIAPKLRTFRFSESPFDIPDEVLNLRTPALTSFSLQDHFMGEKYRFLDPLVSLDDVCIETEFNIDFHWERINDYSLYAFKLLQDLSLVRHLRLSAHVLEVISASLPIQNRELIKFGNLQSLCVRSWCTSGCFWSLIYLLMSCPCIEQFRLEMREVDDEVLAFEDCTLEEAFEESKLYTDRDLVPLQNLRSVTLVSEDIGAFEFAMLKFLQQQGIGAEKITLCLD